MILWLNGKIVMDAHVEDVVAKIWSIVLWNLQMALTKIRSIAVRIVGILGG
jgi:hypothetical protein